MIPTYYEIATQMGVRLCKRCPPEKFIEDRNHLSGVATPSVVHLSPRRSTRAGIRKMLILVAEAKDPAIQSLTPWLRIWMSNIEAYRQARMLAISLPRSLADKDRARVRFYLGELTGKDRDYYGEIYVKALRWAARS